MNYQAFVDKLNKKELICKIEESLQSNLDIFVDVEESSVANQFDVKITIVTEKMDRFYNSEEVYLFKVSLDENDKFVDAEVSFKLDGDTMIRIYTMSDMIENYFIRSFKGE